MPHDRAARAIVRARVPIARARGLFRRRRLRGRAGAPRRLQDREPEAARQPARAAPLPGRGDDARVRSAWASRPASTTTRCRARGRCCSPPASRMPGCPPCSATATATSSAASRTNGPRARVRGSPRATATASTAAAPPTTRASTPSTWRPSTRVRAERGGRLGFNAKFIIEMGEEAGSKGLAELVARAQGGLRRRRSHRLGRPAREARSGRP